MLSSSETDVATDDISEVKEVSSLPLCVLRVRDQDMNIKASDENKQLFNIFKTNGEHLANDHEYPYKSHNKLVILSCIMLHTKLSFA